MPGELSADRWADTIDRARPRVKKPGVKADRCTHMHSMQAPEQRRCRGLARSCEVDNATSHALARPTCTHAARHSVRICKRCTQCSAHAGGAAAALMCRSTCPPTGGHSTARGSQQAPDHSRRTPTASPPVGDVRRKGGSMRADPWSALHTHARAREATSLPSAAAVRPRPDARSQPPPGAAHEHPCRRVLARHARSVFKIHKSAGAHITHTRVVRIYCTDALSYADRACICAGRGPFAPRAFQ